MIIIPTNPAVTPITFGTYSSSGGAGNTGVSGYVMTRTWTHTLAEPGAIIVFAGVIHEGTTSDTTSLKINGSTSTALAASYAKSANQRFWVKMWGAIVGASTVDLELTQTNASNPYQYAEVSTISYFGASAFGSAATYPDVAAISVNASAGRHVVCGIYGNGTPVSPNNRGTTGWAQVGDQAGGINPATFTWTGSPIAAATVLLN